MMRRSFSCNRYLDITKRAGMQLQQHCKSADEEMRSNAAYDDGYALTLSPVCDDHLLSTFSKDAFTNARSIIADSTRFVKFGRSHRSPAVEYFSIVDSLHISDFGVHNICYSFPNLVCLCLRGSLAITNKSLGIIVSSLRKLQSLQIASCKNILSNLSSKKELLSLQYVLKKIKRLDISGNDHFEDELFLSTFVRVKTLYGYRKPKNSTSKLEHMNFSRLPKIQRTTWHYLFSKSFGNIVSLTLAYTTVGDEGLIAFSKVCKPILHIDLSYCPNVTEVGIKPIIEKSKALVLVNLNGINIEGIDFLVDTMEICQELRVLKAKNIQFEYRDNGAVLKMISALCQFAPWLEQLDLDMFLQISNTALLKSKMKIVLKNIRDNYANIAFGLPPSSIQQSSYNVDKSRDGSLAVDGRMSSRFGEAWCDHSATTTMTGIDIEAFLDLDLNRPYNVSEIFVKLPDDRQ